MGEEWSMSYENVHIFRRQFPRWLFMMYILTPLKKSQLLSNLSQIAFCRHFFPNNIRLKTNAIMALISLYNTPSLIQEVNLISFVLKTFWMWKWKMRVQMVHITVEVIQWLNRRQFSQPKPPQIFKLQCCFFYSNPSNYSTF